ncbi:hypothetical protein EON65_35095 [archaeon]|nr:MAG: hypothetical protein EON65_35095 [archaeon]
MHGIQVCPVTVKVSWAKLFPEDNHDDNEDNEDGGELFPVQIAFKTPKIKQMLPAIPHKGNLNSDGEEDGEDDVLESPGKSPSQGKTKRGLLGDGEDHNSFRSASAGALDDGGGGMSPDPNKPKSAPQRAGGSAGGSLTRSNDSNSQSTSYADSFRQQVQHKSILELRADELLDDHRIHKPFLRTYLQPPPEKPPSLRGAMLKRQNNVQKINAQEVSPAMALFLASRSNSQGLFEHHFSQTIRRTVPVQWCAAGGSDTHRKRYIPYELHEEISDKLQHSKQDYHEVTVQYHRKKMSTLKSLDKSLTKVLSSGSTNISRMSLDLIRRQRSSRGGNEPSDAPTGIEEVDMAEMAQLAMYDDEEIDRFLADL